MRSGRFVALAVLGGMLALTGCDGASSSGGSSSSTTTSTRHLDESSNGKHLDVHFGDTIIVTLHSTYWTFGVPGGFILQPVTPPQIGKGANCPTVPGNGCGTVTITYNVGKVGSGTIVAHRTSCGEALKCTGAQGNWSVSLTAS